MTVELADRNLSFQADVSLSLGPQRVTMETPMAGCAMYYLALARSSPSGVGGGGSVGLVAAMERAGGRGLRVGRLAGCPELSQPRLNVCVLPSPFRSRRSSYSHD